MQRERNDLNELIIYSVVWIELITSDILIFRLISSFNTSESNLNALKRSLYLSK